YYEESGVIRDMFQNHLMQLLTLTAMEPPNAFDADAVRGEKAKVLGAIHPIAPEDADDMSVIGQYDAGEVNGEHVIAYRDEPGVAKDSRVPTYAAIRFTVDNWRWHGVPFFLRSGKRLAKHATEIAVQFKEPPHSLFRIRGGLPIERNVLVMRIQPDEGISLRFETKVPGVDVQMAPVRMVFNYADAYGQSTHPAYETLLLDCMLGDATLFARWDEVEASWRIIDPIIDGWKNPGLVKLPNYTSGTWGPSAADALMAKDGAAWREP
ncbi:MAG TPA: glucose-6-phosphate dehydrogenase, partial [Candidatus Tumulicola sp.]|nr:glucose-6-phosphate dehydrogenase [Candidatus Tumulicola sp.]